MPAAAVAERHLDVAVMQPGYLPWLGYFDMVALADAFVLYDDVQFDKGGWRNRNRILGSRGGPQWLTAPAMTAGRLGQTIRDTELKPNNWQVKHLRTIQQIYARAPFFDWCFPGIDRYLGGGTYRWLVDLCLDGHNGLSALLGLQTPLILSSELGFRGIGATERLVAICKSCGATRYIAANASKSYMDESLWRAAGIALVYQNYPHPAYAQFDDDFVSHLSILDALMFVGPATRTLVGVSHPKERNAAPMHRQIVTVDVAGLDSGYPTITPAGS